MKKNTADYVINNNYDDEWRDYYEEHTNYAYPTYVYYLDMDNMVMGGAGLHWHREIEVDFVRNGSAVFNIGGVKHIVSEGNAIVINEGRVHSISNANPGKKCIIVSILFNISYLFDSNDSLLALKYKTVISDNINLNFFVFNQNESKDIRGLECIESLLKTNLEKKFGYELMTKSILCNFWLLLLEKSNDDSPIGKSNLLPIDESRIKCAVSYIHRNYMNSITLDDIAESIHVSKSECCRCFKRTTEMTPFDFLLRERIIESARKMQRNDNDSSSMINLSKAVGFNNTSYYNKIFRKFMGCTPSHYKSEIKKSHRDALSPFGISLSRS